MRAINIVTHSIFFCKQFKINKMEHFVFLVFIADIPVMYKKIEIRNGGELWGDDEFVCGAFYVQKIVLTSTEKLKNL
jgi:hypothetical protein